MLMLFYPLPVPPKITYQMASHGVDQTGKRNGSNHLVGLQEAQEDILDNVLCLIRINMKARCHEGKKLLVVKCIVISNNSLFSYCIVHDCQSSVGISQRLIHFLIVVCKGKKNSCYDHIKESKKLKINQNMTDAPPFGTHFAKTWSIE